MTNNDILRRLRYTFELSDADMAAVFALADLKVRRGHIIAWLLKDDDPAFEECNDRMLATFLNGFINMRRGKRDGPQPKPETRLTNNLILLKLKIALRLESHAILAITEAGGFALTAPELSAFMRKPGHRNYRECKDQVLRHFLKGVQLKYREDSGKQPEEKPKPKPSVWGKRS